VANVSKLLLLEIELNSTEFYKSEW